MSRQSSVQGKPDTTSMPTSRQLLRALETMAGVGFGIFNIDDGTVRWSDGLHVMACDTESVGQTLPLDAMADLFSCRRPSQAFRGLPSDDARFGANSSPLSPGSTR